MVAEVEQRLLGRRPPRRTRAGRVLDRDRGVARQGREVEPGHASRRISRAGSAPPRRCARCVLPAPPARSPRAAPTASRASFDQGERQRFAGETKKAARPSAGRVGRSSTSCRPRPAQGSVSGGTLPVYIGLALYCSTKNRPTTPSAAATGTATRSPVSRRAPPKTDSARISQTGCSPPTCRPGWGSGCCPRRTARREDSHGREDQNLSPQNWKTAIPTASSSPTIEPT